MYDKEKNMTPSYRLSGFSLVELSVALIVIGLLTAGITAGGSLITNMRIQKTIKELRSLQTSVNDFVEIRHYYPGDYPTAADEWTAVSGNGDWLVSSAESAHVMQHLHEAGHIERIYTAGGSLTRGGNLKQAPLKPGAYWFHTHTTNIHGRKGEAIDIAGAISASTNGGLNPENAYLIDSKIDDGHVMTGDFTASDGADAVSAGMSCMSGSGDDAVYHTSIDNIACVGHYWISEQ